MPNAYRFFINGREVARGSIRVGSYLALAAGNAPLPVEGEATQEPAFGLPAKWIAENDKARAELAGYTVVDAVSVLITHLSEMLRKHASELLGREDLKQLVDKVRETSPSLVDELIPNVLNMGLLHRVLVLLLDERVPISNMIAHPRMPRQSRRPGQGPGGADRTRAGRTGPDHLRSFSRCRNRNWRPSFSIRAWRRSCGVGCTKRP